MSKEMDEINKLFNDQYFDYNIVNDFINHNYYSYMKEKYYPYELQDTFCNSYFPKNINKVKELVNISKNEYITDQYRKVLLCKNLIYHNDNNINDRSRLEFKLANMFIFKRKFQDLNYDEVIKFYSNQLNVDMVLARLTEYNLLLNMNDSRIFGIEGIPYKDEKTIISNYCNNQTLGYNGEPFNTINGRYGEYLVFNELRKDNNNINLWVSKDVGDGFGYDMMSVSKNTYQTKMIEVKTTITDNIDPRWLSYNEENILYCLSYDFCNNERYDYELKVVSLRENEEPIIYTFTLDKELSIGKKNFIFNVSSNQSNDSYIAESYLALDYNNKQRIHLAIPEELKPHNKIYVIK